MIPRGTTLLFALLGLACAQLEQAIEHLAPGQQEAIQDKREKMAMYRKMLREVPKMDGGQVMFQGDMLMTERDLLEMYGMVPSRNIIWPGGIVPYKISESSANEADLIRQGVAHWMNNSCLTFREIEKDDTATDFILFIRDRGCWSQFGHVGSLQNISIGDGCDTLNTVVHEIGHAIGFLHEHSRADRDRYVVVNYPNILDHRSSQFHKEQNKREYGALYDYTSVMHYVPTAFSVSPEMKTLTPVNPLLAPLISRGDGLTFRDRRKANFLYRCDAACTRTPVCANEGFVDHTCKCVCPPNTEGEQCETLRRSYYSRPYCGGRVFRQKEISSPGYPVIQLPKYGVCVWWIQAPPNQRVQLTFRAFDLYGRRDGKFCRHDWFEIRLRSLYLGQTFCGNEIKPGDVVTSVGRDMVIEYRPYKNMNRGFSAKVKFLPV